ncbi:Conserved_hypothetical protein [Hexamita inflata]|uniref:Uncharacterized protein n=1 Tax=Hexamita inflata TaxID=28002 RepID=A0AA86TGW8_9EUKA|nr:Conserved hypothetical protein [Hexamita inflata]
MAQILDWKLDTPSILIDNVDQIYTDIQSLKLKFHQYHSTMRRTHFAQLNDLKHVSKSKVDHSYFDTFMQDCKKYHESLLIDQQEFQLMTDQNIFKVNEQAESVSMLLKAAPQIKQQLADITTNYLYPAVTCQIQTLKQLGSHQDQAKQISLSLYRMIKDFNNDIQDNQKCVTRCESEFHSILSQVQKLESRFQQQEPELRKIAVQIWESIANQNIQDLEKMKTGVIDELRAESNNQLSELLHESDLQQKLDITRLLESVDKFILDLNLFSTYQSEEINHMRERIGRKLIEFDLEIQNMMFTHTERINNFVAESLNEISHTFAPNNQLNQIGNQITSLQTSWTNDIQNFKKVFIEGKLKSQQETIQQKFELNYKEDAANVLQFVQKLLNELKSKQSKFTIEYNQKHHQKLQDLKQNEIQMRETHKQCTDTTNQRIVAFNTLATRLTAETDKLMKAINDKMNAYEFQQKINQKLNKNDVDIAFSVKSREQYQYSQFVDTSRMDGWRLGSEPLNRQSQQVQTSFNKTRTNALQNSFAQLPNHSNTINTEFEFGVNGKYISAELVKNDPLLLKVDETLNRIAFGHSIKELKEAKVVRSKSAKRAFQDKRKWRIDGKMDIDEYISEFQKEME